jgi:glycogen operon protein
MAFNVEVRQADLWLHLMLNAFWEKLDFELPRCANGHPCTWRRWIDTALDSPNDIAEWSSAPAVPGASYSVQPRSVVALVATVPAKS